METREIYETTTRRFLAPIQDLLNDPSVSEIMINGPRSIYFERQGKIQRADCEFASEHALLAAARNIAEFVNRRVDADHHSLDGRLPDGSRVHIIIPPSSRVGVCLTIRRFQKSTFQLASLVERGSMTAEAMEFLQLAVMLHKSILISGGTGSGKTSLLNALSAAIPDTERIIVIEDTSELQLNQPHTVYLEAQPPRPDGGGGVTIRDLFVDSLRMRPDRIVVGEVRRGEALDLVQSMISGHTGALATVHANSPRESAVRLETLCLMSDVSLPIHVARMQTASALQLVVQIARMSDGSRRLQAISECLGLDAQNNYVFRDLYRFQARGRNAVGMIQGELVPTGLQPSFWDEPNQFGLLDQIKLTKALFAPPPSISSEITANDIKMNTHDAQ